MEVSIDLVAATPPLARMWELRSNLTGRSAASTAAYIAVAETYGCVLVTADARLASAPDLRCEIRLALPTR